MHRDMKNELRSSATATTTHVPVQNSDLFISSGEPLSGALRGCLGSLDGACIEKLLLHCASALEANDVTLAQQVMWVLNNVASSHGNVNQRLTSWLLKALVARAARLCPASMPFAAAAGLAKARTMTVTELVGYVDLTPWHRFGFSASNGAILAAVRGRPQVHVLDFGIAHCMQWPTLIDALSKRPEGPPTLRITVPSARPLVPPFINVSAREIGRRLTKFAKSREVPFEFHVLKSDSTDLSDANFEKSTKFRQEFLSCMSDPSALSLSEDEALVVNCQNWLRFLRPEESGSRQDAVTSDPSYRDQFLELLLGLNPCIVTVTDEDSDLDCRSLSSRIVSCFNYMWMPFDALETFLPKDSAQRMEYEADIGQKIENIIGFEGPQRMEKPEPGARLAQRMRRSGFRCVPFDEETVREVKLLLNEHASGWGMKKEEDDMMLVLTWKGHRAVFTAAWAPNGFDE